MKMKFVVAVPTVLTHLGGVVVGYIQGTFLCLWSGNRSHRAVPRTQQNEGGNDVS